jgi:hypothetical protein
VKTLNEICLWLFRIALLAMLVFACQQLHELRKDTETTMRILDKCSTFEGVFQVEQASRGRR